MAGRIRGFVKIDYSGTDILLEVALEWCTTARNRGEMSSSDKYYLASVDIALSAMENGTAYACHSLSIVTARYLCQALV